MDPGCYVGSRTPWWKCGSVVFLETGLNHIDDPIWLETKSRDRFYEYTHFRMQFWIPLLSFLLGFFMSKFKTKLKNRPTGLSHTFLFNMSRSLLSEFYPTYYRNREWIHFVIDLLDNLQTLRIQLASNTEVLETLDALVASCHIIVEELPIIK